MDYDALQAEVIAARRDVGDATAHHRVYKILGGPEQAAVVRHYDGVRKEAIKRLDTVIKAAGEAGFTRVDVFSIHEP